jgi:HK97 family phage prohead protease
VTLEHRSLLEQPEFRSEGTRIVASGVAMRYGARSKPIGGKFREQFPPGSFAKTIKEQNVHSHNEHLGPYLAQTGNGSLRLTDSRSELGYELDLPDTTAGRDAAALLERGDIKGSSIGFRAIPTAVKWTVDEDGMALRSVGEAKLARVDLTIAPYYDDSTAELALRSLATDKGLELRSVMEAAERGELPTLISSSTEDDDEEQRSDLTPAGDPPARDRITWLYL